MFSSGINTTTIGKLLRRCGKNILRVRSFLLALIEDLDLELEIKSSNYHSGFYSIASISVTETRTIGEVEYQFVGSVSFYNNSQDRVGMNKIVCQSSID